MFRGYSEIVFEAKYKTKYGEGIQILNPEQMFERLPIVLAQVKAGKTSEKLLKEIRKIIYYLYRVKKKLIKRYTTI